MNNEHSTDGDEEKIPLRLVVGLGNPGKEYEGTRHNVGFAVVEAMARHHNASFSFEAKWNAQVAKIPSSSLGEPPLVLIKPMTFMNLSGTAVGSYARFFHYKALQALVVLDDVALPLGTLRLRRSGSHGGQRGLESILTHFSTEVVPRLRIGVGPLDDIPAAPLSDYVLSRFHKKETELVDETISRAVEAIECVQQSGLDVAMNSYNASSSPS